MGEMYENMKSTRASFRRVIRQSKIDDQCIRNGQLLASFSLKWKTKFWRDIKNMKRNNNKTTSMDEKENVKDIIEIVNSNLNLSLRIKMSIPII